MNTEKIIAYCGLNCAACDARIATVTNDNELRAKVGKEWKARYNEPDILPAMINCTGCRDVGVKIGYCKQCVIRSCAISKNFQTCAECDKFENCPTLKGLHHYVPDALENLKSLN
jgi:hypothetical protein